MNEIWQIVIVAAIVTLALGYLGRRLWQLFFRPNCSCSTCPAKESQPLAQVDAQGTGRKAQDAGHRIPG